METRSARAGSGARLGRVSAPAAAALALALPASLALGPEDATAQGVAPGASSGRAAAEFYVPPGESPATARVEPPPMTGRTRTGAVWQGAGAYAVVEGDMIVGRIDTSGRLMPGASRRGLGHTRLIGRWPSGIVPYEITASIDETTRATIQAAVDHWNTNTRLSFVERTAENAAEFTEFVQFFQTGGCASYVGRADEQPQPVYVQACTVGSVIHELGHAIGLYHEHTRSDRDSWITVDESQIVEGRFNNFRIQRANAQDLGAYDYESIMHYGPYFFARGDAPTIIAPAGISIGQRVALSEGDIRSANALYATDLALTVVTREIGGAFELDVTVDTLGQLGAAELELVVTIDSGTRWTGMTEDTGWSCSTSGSELRCMRPTLPETAPQTRLLLQAEPGAGATPGDVRARLASRTLDTNMDNNVVGAGVPAPAAARELAASDGRAFQRAEEPATGAAEPAPENPFAVEGSAPASSVASAEDSGGGGGGGSGASGFGSLLALAIAFAAARVRRGVRLRRRLASRAAARR